MGWLENYADVTTPNWRRVPVITQYDQADNFRQHGQAKTQGAIASECSNGQELIIGGYTNRQEEMSGRKSRASQLDGRLGMSFQLKLRLPATHGDVMQTQQDEIFEPDCEWSVVANSPVGICSFLHAATFMLLMRVERKMSAATVSERWGNGVELRTSIKRETHLAMFFASFARVMGPGGLLKSFVGICRLHWP